MAVLADSPLPTMPSLARNGVIRYLPFSPDRLSQDFNILSKNVTDSTGHPDLKGVINSRSLGKVMEMERYKIMCTQDGKEPAVI
jgi:hypothetical protein